jgi:hypothetical protein
MGVLNSVEGRERANVCADGPYPRPTIRSKYDPNMI